jgi:2,4-dienoyl-CoA reductase-like NADH-dependent reductase (Old Yellow Enzyme family)
MDAHIEHYVRRARAGVGMVIVEHSYVRGDGRVNQQQLGIYDDFHIPGLNRLAEAVKACDTVVGVQITHAGSKSTRAIIGSEPVAPSAILVPTGKELPRSLLGDEIEAICDAFVLAAERALKAGFDFVEIHGAHGYLLSQFLSPLTNQRQDEYGGDINNRLRLPLKIVEAVRQLVDENHLLLYRLGANDFMPDGLTANEGIQAAVALAAAGVDILDISGGHIGAGHPDWDGIAQGYFVPMASAIRDEVDAPVIVAGGITDPRFADRIIQEGKVDLVAIGRAMLANPNWAEEAKENLSVGS